MSRRFTVTYLQSIFAATALLTSAAARAETPGCSAKGVIAPAFPTHMLIGIGSGTADDTWAQKSGTKWDVQWMYLTGQAGNNWYNNYGSSPADGSFIDGFFATIDGHGFIPGIHLYNMGFGHDTGDSGILSEVQNPSWTREYFSEFKVLLQRAKTFGKPVVIVLEGDSFAFLENLTSNNPSAMAAVASSGVPELAALPNTVAGLGMAYLAIRKSVGAYNVAMGPDTPYYAEQGDIMNFAPTNSQPLQPHIDFQWKFFGSFVGPNATGDRFDFTASCPMAGDCASYTDGRPCWDPSDSASLNGPSINRYISWLHLFNQTSGTRWMLHQVPLGNSQHKNVPFNGSAKSGYKDNKAEYLFQVESPASTAIRDQHIANFANAGVIGMLFGFSDDGDTPATDMWTDNQPFLKTHVALVNNGGGFAIASNGSCGDAGAGGGSSGNASASSGATGGGASGSSSGPAGGGSGGTSNGSSSGSSHTGGASSSGLGGGGGRDAAAYGGGSGAGGNSPSAPDGGADAWDGGSGKGCALARGRATGGGAVSTLVLSLALLLRRRRA